MFAPGCEKKYAVIVDRQLLAGMRAAPVGSRVRFRCALALILPALKKHLHGAA